MREFSPPLRPRLTTLPGRALGRSLVRARAHASRAAMLKLIFKETSNGVARHQESGSCFSKGNFRQRAPEK